MPPYEQVDVTQLADVHAVARKLARGLRSGEGGDLLMNVGTHLPTKPPIAGGMATQDSLGIAFCSACAVLK